MSSPISPEQLSAWEKEWRTEMGAWFPGERVVVRGKDLLTDLSELDFVGYILYGITGKIHSPSTVRVLGALWTIMTSFPEPRLWNNRVGTLAGAARSTSGLGVSAGSALSESVIFGYRHILVICQMLEDILARRSRGEPLAAILKSRLDQPSRGKSNKGKNRRLAKIPGFGRPVANRDERIKPTMALLEHFGFDALPYVSLVFDIERTLKQEMDLDWAMNAAALASAIGLDQGLTPRQNYQFNAFCFSAGVLLCQIDAEIHPEGSFFPMRCDAIRYQGVSPRSWKVEKS